eukprot:c18495_g1_i1 orf=316-633(+)
MHSLVWKKMRKVKNFRTRALRGEYACIAFDGSPQLSQDDTGLANYRKKEPKQKDPSHTCNTEDAEFGVRKKAMNVKGNRRRAQQEEDMSGVCDSNIVKARNNNGV